MAIADITLCPSAVLWCVTEYMSYWNCLCPGNYGQTSRHP